MSEILTYLCPFCGSDVRVGSPCPGCAKKPKKPSPSSSESSNSLDPADDDFDYDEFIQREFGRLPHHRLRLRWYWWMLAILLIFSMILALFWPR